MEHPGGEVGEEEQASISELDEAMKEIQASLDDFGEQTTADASDDDSDSDEEEEGRWSLLLISLTLCYCFVISRCAKDRRSGVT